MFYKSFLKLFLIINDHQGYWILCQLCNFRKFSYCLLKFYCFKKFFVCVNLLIQTFLSLSQMQTAIFRRHQSCKLTFFPTFLFYPNNKILKSYFDDRYSTASSVFMHFDLHFISNVVLKGTYSCEIKVLFSYFYVGSSQQSKL